VNSGGAPGGSGLRRRNGYGGLYSQSSLDPALGAWTEETCLDLRLTSIMRYLLGITLLVSIFLAPACSAYGKGQVDELVIKGGGLEPPLEIRDRLMLTGLDPWMGGFINWQVGPVAAPSRARPAYEILFYVKWKGRHSGFDRGALKLIYDVLYCPGTASEPGHVYLPGSDDKYSVNMGTIIRKDDDGKWHQASVRLDSLMKRVTVK
jgi:hypothetical protein